MRPLVQHVVNRTRARLLNGDTPVADNVLSMSESHAPNEFGKLVTIQESERQIITAYDLHAKRPAAVTVWIAARSCARRVGCFGPRRGSPLDGHRIRRACSLVIEGIPRWVGSRVIANSLVSTETFSKARAVA
jgi:hypothetical protein